MAQIYYPSRVAYDQVDLSWMIGRTIREVSFWEPCYWRFAFEPAEYIQTGCLWRLIHDDAVALTSGDHRQQFGLPAPIDAGRDASNTLATKHITSVQLRQATADLVIDFGGGMRLEIIPDSGGYEAWEIHGLAGVCFVAQGGGHICTWNQGSPRQI